MTTTAMRKTKPAAAEPIMRGSFSWMLVLYSSAERRNTHKRIIPTHTHRVTHAEKHMGQHLSPCIWSERWVTDRQKAERTDEEFGILMGCTHWMCRSDATDMDKSSGRKRVKWAGRACFGRDPGLTTQPRAGTQNGHKRGRARLFSGAPQITHNLPILAE